MQESSVVCSEFTYRFLDWNIDKFLVIYFSIQKSACILFDIKHDIRVVINKCGYV